MLKNEFKKTSTSTNKRFQLVLTCLLAATGSIRQLYIKITTFHCLSVLQKISLRIQLFLHAQANAKSRRCGSNIFLCFCTNLRLVAQ